MSTIHFHGASVTAQAAPGGFFARLEQRTPSGQTRYSRTAFGASHFNQAGYHFLPDVLALKPDVCLIEWTTTSARSFDQAKCDSLVLHLLERSIVPVWLTMPRLDDLDAKRQTVVDARDCARRWNCPIIDLASELTAKAASDGLIRDTVHTTAAGGEVYAQALTDHLSALDLNVGQDWFTDRLSACTQAAPALPLSVIRSVADGGVLAERIDSEASFQFRASAGLVELVFEGVIGPHSPILEVTLTKGDGELIHRQRVFIFDAWCYYERTMVNPIISLRLESGLYRCSIRISHDDPNREVELRQPLRLPFDGIRRLHLRRYSCLNMEIIQ